MSNSKKWISVSPLSSTKQLDEETHSLAHLAGPSFLCLLSLIVFVLFSLGWLLKWLPATKTLKQPMIIECVHRSKKWHRCSTNWSIAIRWQIKGQHWFVFVWIRRYRRDTILFLFFFGFPESKLVEEIKEFVERGMFDCSINWSKWKDYHHRFRVGLFLSGRGELNATRLSGSGSEERCNHWNLIKAIWMMRMMDSRTLVPSFLSSLIG